MILNCDASLVSFGMKPRYSRAKIGIGYSADVPYVLMITNQRREKLKFTKGCKLFKSAISFEESERDLYIKNADKLQLDLMMSKLRKIKDGKEKVELPKLENLDLQKVQTSKLNVVGNNYDSKELKNKTCTIAAFDKTSSLPKSLWKLTNLTTLQLTNCELTKIPEEIQNLVKLQRLDLSSNQIQSLNMSILFKMLNLLQLNLSHNQLQFIPLELGFFNKLVTLDFGHNEIQNIPFTILSLTDLKELLLPHNKLNLVPYDVLRVMEQRLRLTKIDLYGNFKDKTYRLFDCETDAFLSLWDLAALQIVKSKDTLKSCQEMLPNSMYKRIQSDGNICYQCKKLFFGQNLIVTDIRRFDLSKLASTVVTDGSSLVQVKLTYCYNCTRKIKQASVLTI